MHTKNWDDYVANIEQMAASPAFLALRDRILATAQLQPGDRLLDIGAGTGLLALAAAQRVARVSALDVSPAMCERLERHAHGLELENVETIVAPATALPFADETIDVILSNYCFHHLNDPEKRLALAEAWRVLRPGGRLVFADMMFSLSLASRRDRSVIALLLRRMIRHGPRGLLRLLKNAARILTRRWEHPAGFDWWQTALVDAGFVDVSVAPLDHEGGIACARRHAMSAFSGVR